MSVKVELGFTGSGAGAPYFRLNDPIRGQLDSTEWRLGDGEVLVDVTEFVRRIGIDRGKSRDLDKYQAGRVSVEFNNDQRTFDPTYVDSPYFRQIVPRRQIRVTLDGEVAFAGLVDDWNISYDAGGFSVAVCTAFDAFSALAGITITEPEDDYEDFPEELSGQRIQRVLDFIGWDGPTDIDAGETTLYESLVPFEQNVLSYLQLVADSEPGDFFVNRLGNFAFTSKSGSGAAPLLIADDGTGILFNDIQVIYGSEQLYNVITATNELDSVTVFDDFSVTEYGERDLQVETLIVEGPELEEYAFFLLDRYKLPEYRFESITISLLGKSALERQGLLRLEIGDPIIVKFTPGGIGDPIERTSKLIGVSHQRQPENEIITLRLQTFPEEVTPA